MRKLKIINYGYNVICYLSSHNKTCTKSIHSHDLFISNKFLLFVMMQLFIIQKLNLTVGEQKKE